MPIAAATLPIIRPLTDLRTNLNDVCDQARESREPLIFTKNGTPALVVMDSAAYEEQRQRDRIYLAVREAEIEQKFTPGTISEVEAKAQMDNLFATLGISHA